MKVKKKYTIALVVLVPIVLYLLWPLHSDIWDFEWDQKTIEGKKAFLAEERKTSGEITNVLLITVDDLSVADMTMYDAEGPVETPHMNRIASEGVLFTNAYVTAPICSPSRAAIATGRYPQRFGYEHQMHDRYLRNRLEYFAFRYFIDSHPWKPKWQTRVPDRESIAMQGLPPGEITIGEILKNHGYATGIVGKWHLGEGESNMPCNRGFDYYYGFNASHSLYVYEETEGYVDQRIEDDWTDDYIWKQQRHGPFGIFENCEPVEELEYLTDRIADLSIDFMENKREEPFFLWASFNAPHTPLQAPREYVDQFAHVDDPVKRVHYAMIKCLDDAIGRVNSYLEESGLDSNTLVFLISDNGGAQYNLTTENGPYRGGKITNFEGGLKVPMAMKWPGKLDAGQVYEPMVSSMDIFGTIVSVLDLALPGDRGYDGVDLYQAVNDNIDAHDHLFWRMGYNHAIRSRDWKLTWNTHTNTMNLFHIAEDPYESDDLSGNREAVTEMLMAAYDAWTSELMEPLWPAVIHFIYEEEGGGQWYFDD